MNAMKRLFRSKAFIGLIVTGAALGGYGIYRSAAKPADTVRYVTAAATKQSLSVSVSGSGQISSTSQVDIKPSASGTITWISVKQGQTVASGALIASIDSRDAQRAVADAQTGVETAQLTLQKAFSPTDALTALQQQNALVNAQNSLKDAQDSLAKAYDDGFTTVSSSFLDLPTLMTGLQDTLMGNDASQNQWNIDYYGDVANQYDPAGRSYRDDAYEAYLAARDSYDRNFADFKAADRTSEPKTITAIIDETYATALKIATAVKSSNDLIQFYKDQLTVHGLKPIAAAEANLTQLNSYTGTINNRTTALLAAKQNIKNSIQAIADAQRSIAEKEASISKTEAGPDQLDIRSLQISLQQKQNALLDAKDKLADYYVRAPFAGIIAKVNQAKGDTASSGTAIATIISPKQIAQITLNESDVAKIKTGQKATLTFDAIDELTLTGTVAQVDELGTASQGVVSYTVEIALDTQDSRIKPGMSVNAAIITAFKADTLTVPNTAVKNQNGGAYVQTLGKDGKPERKTVTTGLASDTDTEILSGLAEGDEVVTQTVTPSASSSSSSSKTGSGIPGLGGGNVRLQTGGFGGR